MPKGSPRPTAGRKKAPYKKVKRQIVIRPDQEAFLKTLPNYSASEFVRLAIDGEIKRRVTRKL